MADANLELGEMILETLLDVGPVFQFVYLQAGFDFVAFTGLLDRFPPALTRVASGDMRVRCSVDSFPGVVNFGPPDLVQEVTSGLLYDVVASSLDLLGAARVFQLRRHEGLGSAIAGTTQQCVVFSSESVVVQGSYLGGRMRWGYGVVLNSASVVCSAPSVSPMQLTLEVNSVLTDKVLTVPVGALSAEMDLGALAVAGGVFVRWCCTGAPAPDFASSMVYLTMLLTI